MKAKYDCDTLVICIFSSFPLYMYIINCTYYLKLFNISK